MVLWLDAYSGRVLEDLRGWIYTGWVTSGGGWGEKLYQILTHTTSIFKSYQYIWYAK